MTCESERWLLLQQMSFLFVCLFVCLGLFFVSKRVPETVYGSQFDRVNLSERFEECDEFA